jgi:hypothetical protein
MIKKRLSTPAYQTSYEQRAITLRWVNSWREDRVDGSEVLEVPVVRVDDLVGCTE